VTTTEKILRRAMNRLRREAEHHRKVSNLKAALAAEHAVSAIQMAIRWAADADSYSTTGRSG
jgi:hypothetical protein